LLRVSPGERPTRRLIAIAGPGVMALLVACGGAPAPKATPVASMSAAVSTVAPAATTTTAATAAAAKATAPSASATPPATTTPATTPTVAAAAPKTTPPPAPPAPSVTTVASSIANFAFAPVSGSAPLVVTWTNNDTVEHDVIFADASSPALAPGATFQRRFETRGTFAFSCSFHPFMTGSVTVR